MERHGRVSEGSQSDPSPEWTAPGTETGPEGLFIFNRIHIWDIIFPTFWFVITFYGGDWIKRERECDYWMWSWILFQFIFISAENE